MADGDEHLGRTVPALYGPDGKPDAPPAAPPRTIVSGVERIKSAVADAETALGEFRDFVSQMGGDVLQADRAQPSFGTTTVDMIHFAAGLVEGVGECVADLVKRARAAHG